MRISADRNSPFFSPRSRFAYVLLDGLRIRDCIEADEERGVAVCLARDGRGRIQRRQGGAKLVERRGRVKVGFTGGA